MPRALSLAALLLAGCIGVPIHARTKQKPLAPSFAESVPYEWVEVPTERDDTKLRGVWCANDGPPVLLLYGSGMGVARAWPFVEMLHQGGYAVLCCDYRGTGFSSGRWWTSRHLDDDALALWEWMRKEKGEPGGVVGVSIGSVAAAKLLEAEHPPAAVVLDRPVDPKTVIPRFMRASLGSISAAISRVVARPKVDVDMGGHLARARTDALVVLPEFDMYCTPSDAAKMTAGKADSVTVVTVPGGHLSSHLVDPPLWRSKVLDFLDARLRPGLPPLGGRDVPPDLADVERFDLDGRAFTVALDRVPDGPCALLLLGKKGNGLIRVEQPEREMEFRLPGKYARRFRPLFAVRVVAPDYRGTTGTRWVFGAPGDVTERARAEYAASDWGPYKQEDR